MRYNLRRAPAQKPVQQNSFWLSFSDLMSALLLVFILIMFYSIYQYFDMLEIKTAELLRQSALIEEKEMALEDAQTELEDAQTKLTESETLLVAEQAKLLLQQQELDSLTEALEAQKTELEDAQSLLEDQTAELEAAQLVVAAQQEKLDDQQMQLDEIVGVRRRIIDELVTALDEAHIKATVDEKTGAIALDGSVLFELSQSSISDEGKTMLDELLPIYLDVLLAEEHRGNVAEIIIEGHTDSNGTYIGNMELSQSRAFAVANYVLGESEALTKEEKEILEGYLTVNGRSESVLIYNEQGKEDRKASRRVEIKFRLQDEDMIQQMADLLDEMNGDD